MSTKIGSKVMVLPINRRQKPTKDIEGIPAKVISQRWNIIKVEYSDGSVELVNEKRVLAS